MKQPLDLALEVAECALELARAGITVRAPAWSECGDRYWRPFKDRRAAMIAQFVAWVPMLKGRRDPNGSTATATSSLSEAKRIRLDASRIPGFLMAHGRRNGGVLAF